MQKLIIIRGPSGSGKSSVAKKLHEQCVRPTLLISEDKTRQMFSDWRKPHHTASKQLATMSIIHGLLSKYDVIYEGISNIKTYRPYFEEIFSSHPKNNYFFYLDVSFEETVRRHNTRAKKDEFDVETMSKWWDYATPTGYSGETIIPEEISLEDTVAIISRIAKLPKPE